MRLSISLPAFEAGDIASSQQSLRRGSTIGSKLAKRSAGYFVSNGLQGAHALSAVSVLHLNRQCQLHANEVGVAQQHKQKASRFQKQHQSLARIHLSLWVALNKGCFSELHN